MSKATKNYDWFKFLANNRPISKKHLNDLRKQFQQYGNITEISPITVNKHGFILDGQHRRILCEEFGYEINYDEVDVKKEITPAMNTNQKPWKSADYVRFFAAYKPEYEMLRKFISNNDINFPVAAAVLFPQQSSSTIHDKLTEGNLEVDPYLTEGQKRMDIINDIADIMGQELTERYARGIIRCLYMDNFDIQRFINKTKLVMQSTTQIARPRATTMLDVLHNIETIYNYHTGESSRALLFR